MNTKTKDASRQITQETVIENGVRRVVEVNGVRKIRIPDAWRIKDDTTSRSIPDDMQDAIGLNRYPKADLTFINAATAPDIKARPFREKHQIVDTDVVNLILSGDGREAYKLLSGVTEAFHDEPLKKLLGLLNETAEYA